MVDLIESIVCSCCCNHDDCKINNKLGCAENISGEVYIMDIENGLKAWLYSFDTNSATKCFEAVNVLKQKLEDQE